MEAENAKRKLKTFKILLEKAEEEVGFAQHLLKQTRERFEENERNIQLLELEAERISQTLKSKQVSVYALKTSMYFSGQLNSGIGFCISERERISKEFEMRKGNLNKTYRRSFGIKSLIDKNEQIILDADQKKEQEMIDDISLLRAL
ncbi:flagellar export protein FliJ [Vibrio fortis]|uniref:flagellar export protein FliJ n=1 Tax=Vibrio fortis TaxID=212667 RepID=UPI0040683679